MPHGFPTHTFPPPAVSCNITTGVATGVGAGTCNTTLAVCDGANDDTTAFASFNTWAVAWQGSHSGLIDLFIPSGKTCTVASSGPQPNKNLLKVRWDGVGATLLITPTGGFSAGGDGICHSGIAQASGCSARLQTVSAGSSTVTLTSGSLGSGYASRFTVGGWVMVGGIDLQGAGYPPNNHYFEFAKVTNVNAGTGAITLDRPLQDSYKSTWPLYNPGGVGEADQGGPATLWQLDPSWETEVEFRGLTITNNSGGSNQVPGNGKFITYTNVSLDTSSGTCVVPSQNYTWTAIAVSGTGCAMEVDKLVKNANFNRGEFSSLAFQSSSVGAATIDRTVVGTLNGTPKVANISNSAITNFAAGSTGYGRTDRITCTGCVIANFGSRGVLDKGPSEAGINVGFTMSGGVITVPNSVGAQRWIVPGNNIFWSGKYAAETLFRITDVTQDVTNTYVQTNLAAGFPGVPLDAGKLYVQVHPAPQFTCRSCSGNATVLDLNNAPANAPLFSYSSLSYTGAQGISGGVGPAVLWGNISSFTYNETSAYSGGGALSLAISQFSNIPIIKSDFSETTYRPAINVKIAAPASRVVTLSGVTGAQSGDVGLSVPDPSMSWVVGPTSSPTFSADVSSSCPGANCPTVTITTITDQGVVVNFLLNRDLGAANDNSPAFLDRAA